MHYIAEVVLETGNPSRWKNAASHIDEVLKAIERWQDCLRETMFA